MWDGEESLAKVLRMVKSTRNALRKSDIIALIPLSIYNGAQQAFIVGEYTKVCVGLS